MGIEELNLEDERVRAIICEELDRRKIEAQRLCQHRRSGTIMAGGLVRCDECGKTMGEYELENAYAGGEPLLAKTERRSVGGTG